MRKLLLMLFWLPLLSQAQKKPITLEDIFKKGTFRGEYVPADFEQGLAETGFKTESLTGADGKPFGRPDDIIRNPVQKQVALMTKETEPIYRRSSKSLLYLYDDAAKKLSLLEDEKVLHPTFSPDGSRLAYILGNNIYIYELSSGKKTPVTTDGKWNFIINGNCDWVYEEEFEFSRAYDWSPKGNFLAYYRFDETHVLEYNMTIFDNGHNKDYRYKYPKAGDANSVVDIYIYRVADGSRVKAEFEVGDIYIPRIKWTRNDEQLIVFWMNRYQNHLKLLNTNAATGKSVTVYEEQNKYYVEINDDWQFLKDGSQVLFSSEMNGFRHLYLYHMDGKQKTQITSGNFEVTEINAVDEKNKRIFYTMAYPRPMDRNLFMTDFSGKKTIAITQGEYWHQAVFNDSFTRYYLYRSDLNTPQLVTLHELTTDKKKKVTAKQVQVVNENAKLRGRIDEFGFGKAEFIRVPNRKADTLNGWMLKPQNFNEAKQYPVLFCNYGGPGSQQAGNRFGATSPWHQLLAQYGFIVVCVDNTGTGFRGEEFKKKTYLQLGKLEIEDQIDAAKYLSALPFVDKKNIGHWGWSYGGFMSSLAITKGHEVFNAAVAVAPVTSWRYYDNIYTERFMRTPAENPSGYDENSPINFTSMIRGKYLIIHGTADDNVHFQNATQMVSSLVKNNIHFESAFYPNKNHGIGGMADNTTFHLWSKMTNWILQNLGNDQTEKPQQPAKKIKGD